jgi:hypothetical protein
MFGALCRSLIAPRYPPVSSVTQTLCATWPQAMLEHRCPVFIVEADVAAGVGSVRLSELKGLHVRALRPRDLDERGRRRLAGWAVRTAGSARALIRIVPQDHPAADAGVLARNVN